MTAALVILIVSLAVLAVAGLIAANLPASPAPAPAPQPEARLCSCTDGGRNQAVIGCPHCRGEGWVR